MYDLGCGTGKVVTQFAYETLCNSCNGIELGNNTKILLTYILLCYNYYYLLNIRRKKI